MSDNIFVSTPNVEDDTYHVVRKGGEDKNTGNDVGNVAIVGKKDLDNVRFFMQVMVEIEGKVRKFKGRIGKRGLKYRNLS